MPTPKRSHSATGDTARRMSESFADEGHESSDKRSLFRPEAMGGRSARLYGTISIATPLAWQAVGWLLLAALAAAVLFLSLATYARVATVPGVITLDRGVVAVIPSRAGVIEEVDVREGQRVRADQVLARIRAEEELGNGQTAPSRIGRSLEAQDAGLASQGAMLLSAARADQSRLKAQISGLRDEIASLDAQMADQHRLLDVATDDYENARTVAANGFISKHDLDSRQATLLSRRQQLAQLAQLRASKSASISEARSQIAQSVANAKAQFAGTSSQRSGLEQQAAQTDLARGYRLISSVDGVVTALSAKPGQPADPQRQIMVVIPIGSKPVAEIYVPTTAIAFIHPGQEVRLAVDSFAFERFGTVPGEITSISAAAVPKEIAGGPSAAYLATVSLPEPWIQAFGRREPLMPGMTLSAHVVTGRRSLLEWLFEPIYAMRNR